MRQFHNYLSFVLFFVFSCTTTAFVPPLPHRHPSLPTTTTTTPEPIVPSLARQRQSVAAIQLRGMFGLGAPEIAVIMVAAAFLLGPQKLAELGKDAGRIAGELKEVPKEFQEGLKEGEASALSMKKENEVVSEPAAVKAEEPKKE